MTIDGMRAYIAKEYKGHFGFIERVKTMSPNQVCAIYYSILDRKERKKKKQAAKKKTKENKQIFRQMSLFDDFGVK